MTPEEKRLTRLAGEQAAEYQQATAHWRTRAKVAEQALADIQTVGDRAAVEVATTAIDRCAVLYHEMDPGGRESAESRERPPGEAQ